MDKLDLHTPDFTAANIAKLAELFPNCITETRDAETGEVKQAVDFDLLRQELSADAIDAVEGPAERYRLDWPGKRAALATANAPINQTLRPAREESVDFDTTENLYIEGDNLDALKLLQETYLGKVKMIYIDPPYNTGKDFIYSDKFSRSAADELRESGQTDDEGQRLVANTESNGRFHSDWLSMMYPRLKLARNLLKDDGVIFISIDDGEVHNLRKMCDEVFGEENFVANVVWQKVYSPKNSAKWFSEDHDHIIVYARHRESWIPCDLPRTPEMEARYKNPDNDSRGPWKASDLSARNRYDAGVYSVSSPSGRLIDGPPKGRYWVINEDSFNKLDADNRIWWGADGGNIPAVKKFLSEVSSGRTPQTIWPYEEVGHTQDAKKELLKQVHFEHTENVLNSVKPPQLIRRILELTCPPDEPAIVLDFFSGSAPTAQAVLEYNADDGGRRRYIAVQIPEPLRKAEPEFDTIFGMGRQRIINTGQKVLEEWNTKHGKTDASDSEPNTTENLKLETENASEAATPPDVGFRVLKIDSSTYADVHKRPDEVTQAALDIDVENIKPDRSAEDLLFQVLLDWGVDLALPITTKTIADHLVFTVGATAAEDVQAAIIACFEPKLSEDLITAIAKKQPLRAVFRDASFPDDAAKINAEQLFKHHSPHTELKTI